MSKNEELKPCPFCGDTAEIYILSDDVAEIECTNCTCNIKYESDSFTRRDLIEFWNTRHEDKKQ